MPLVDADSAMGTMRFASGSQALGYLGPLNISDDSEARLASLIEERRYPVEPAGAMRAVAGMAKLGSGSGVQARRNSNVQASEPIEDSTSVSV